MTQLIQNINKVEYIETRYLANMMVTPDNTALLRYWRNFNELPIVGLAQLSTSQSVDSNNTITTVSLSALTCQEFATGSKQLAWRVTTVTGTQYLIGTNERPYPTVTVAQAFPESAIAAAGSTVKVEWKTPLDLLKIVD